MADFEVSFNLENQPTLNADFEVEELKNIDVEFDVATGTSYHDLLEHRDFPDQHPIASITGLRDELDDIKSTSTSNKQELLDLINSEQNRAEQAEADLEEDIQNKYTDLSSQIAEETARATAKENLLNSEIIDTNSHIDTVENELSQSILEEKNRAIAEETALNQKIQNETNARQEADQNIINSLNQEIEDRTSAISELNEKLDTEIQRATNSETSLSQKLDNEISERVSANESLQTQITSNANNFSNYRTSSDQDVIDNEIKSLINDEISNRENADEGLQAQITSNLNKFANYRTSSAQDTIDNNIKSLITAEENARKLADSNLQNQITEEVERSSAKETELQNQITANDKDIATIRSYIPNQTSATNQLADKEFVNSSISSSTAVFIGTFTSLQDLQNYSGTLTINDYAFVETIDSAGNVVYNRYKWTGTQWLFEYALNNSSFTAVQWDAINSNITSNLVTQYSNHVASKSNPHNVTKAQVGLGNVDNTSDLNKPISNATQLALNEKQNIIQDLDTIRNLSESAIQPDDNVSLLTNDAGYINKDVNNLTNYYTSETIDTKLSAKANSSDVYTKSQVDTALNLKANISSLSNVATSGSYTDLTNKPVIDNSLSTTSTNAVQNNIVTTALNGKQATISDLSTIRSGASLGATALQSNSQIITDMQGDISSNMGDISALQVDKQDKLTAGTGISIENNIISNTQTSAEWGNIQGTLSNQTDLQNALNNKQNTLVSGTNIKTINGESLLGGGDVEVTGDITYEDLDEEVTINPTPIREEWETFRNSIYDTFYPIGSIYIGVQETCPMESLISGSVWELVATDRVLQGSSSTHTAGSTIEAGLPNITGNIRVVNDYNWDNTGVNNVINGAFKVNTFPATTGATINQNTTVTNDGVWAVSFDASSSSSIYGKSTTVQPPAYVVNIWQRTA